MSAAGPTPSRSQRRTPRPRPGGCCDYTPSWTRSTASLATLERSARAKRTAVRWIHRPAWRNTSLLELEQLHDLVAIVFRDPDRRGRGDRSDSGEPRVTRCPDLHDAAAAARPGPGPRRPRPRTDPAGRSVTPFARRTGKGRAIAARSTCPAWPHSRRPRPLRRQGHGPEVHTGLGPVSPDRPPRRRGGSPRGLVSPPSTRSGLRSASPSLAAPLRSGLRRAYALRFARPTTASGAARLPC